MRCPYCASVDTSTKDTRASGEMRRRRRICNTCNRQFTTYEITSLALENLKNRVKAMDLITAILSDSITERRSRDTEV